MNVYDFDKTIYSGDCTVHFYFYCVRRFPSVLLLLPYQGAAYIMYLLGIYSKTELNERFFKYFGRIKDIEAVVERFWEEKQSGIKKWYLDNQKEDDVIVSASPELLIGSICKRIGIKQYIASRVDAHTGEHDGQTCYGEEKPKRFYERFPKGRIDNFYSDSLSDAPLARLAEEQAYLVDGEKLSAWDI